MTMMPMQGANVWPQTFPKQRPQQAVAIALVRSHSMGKRVNMACVHQGSGWTETRRWTCAVKSIQSGKLVSLASLAKSRIILELKSVQPVLVATSQSMAPAVLHVKRERLHHQITTTKSACHAPLARWPAPAMQVAHHVRLVKRQARIEAFAFSARLAQLQGATERWESNLRKPIFSFFCTFCYLKCWHFLPKSIL